MGATHPETYSSQTEVDTRGLFEYSTRPRGHTRHAITPTKRGSLTSVASSARSSYPAKNASLDASSTPASSTPRSANGAPMESMGYSSLSRTSALSSACMSQQRRKRQEGLNFSHEEEPTRTHASPMLLTRAEGIKTVYNMYLVRPVAVSWPSQLDHTRNL
jgi:hypothetical protein